MVFELLDNGDHVDYYSDLQQAIHDGYRRTKGGSFFEIWQLADGRMTGGTPAFVGSGDPDLR
jgi:hypothetical protein